MIPWQRLRCSPNSRSFSSWAFSQVPSPGSYRWLHLCAWAPAVGMWLEVRNPTSSDFTKPLKLASPTLPLSSLPGWSWCPGWSWKSFIEGNATASNLLPWRRGVLPKRHACLELKWEWEGSSCTVWAVIHLGVHVLQQFNISCWTYNINFQIISMQ